MRIDLQIDELILDGIAVRDHEHLRAVVSVELVRLLAERGIPPRLSQGSNVPALNGSSITLQPGESTEVIGNQIASAVYGGLLGE